jgi:Rho-binding antiterminator
MTRICQDEVGRCDFIDVLEEAALRRGSVSVHLREGEAFIDEVVDVVTEKGEDFAVFKSHERVPVGAILSVTRAQGRARGGEAGRLG